MTVSIFQKIGISLLLCCLLIACGGNKNVKLSLDMDKIDSVIVPRFNADSAYHFIDKQVSFGPRVPNTKGHVDCGIYLVKKLKSYGYSVIEQQANLTAYNGVQLKSKNIIAEIAPEKQQRILLCAHWDSRPYADYDPDPIKVQQAILGADDGASGVGVLIEIARLLQKQKPKYGVDIIFFDSEDYGQPIFSDISLSSHTWCLGSQYWAKNLHRPNYRAHFGILLDMVGSKNARFSLEHYSKQFAPRVQKKVWQKAQAIGHGNYFVSIPGNPITDDHLYVNTLAKIPCINIINLDPNSDTGFGAHWHTHKDNMDVIDKNTLRAVGETVLHVLFDTNI